MKLYLIQHGQSVFEEKDPSKPLSETGRSETEAIMRFLKSKDVKIDVIWHSKKMRSIQTAKVLSGAFPDAERIARDGLNPNDAVDKVAEDIKGAGKEIMVVGHLPFLQKLASFFLVGSEGSDLVCFKNSGVVCLEYNQSWKITWYVTADLVY